MTFEEFENFQNRLLEEVKQMGSTKGKEYAFKHEDRFQNFNEDAEEMGIDRLLCAWIFTNKHIRSLRSYIRNKSTFSTEPIRGRIIDIIVYLILIAGMIEEEENKNEEKLKTNEKKLESNTPREYTGTFH